MNLVGFRAPDDASGLILVLRDLSPVKVGQVGFSPWGNYWQYYMGRWCCFRGRAPDDIGIVFEVYGYYRIRASVAALIMPHHGWLEEPFQKDVRRDGVTLGTHASKDIRRLITFSSHMMKLESLELS